MHKHIMKNLLVRPLALLFLLVAFANPALAQGSDARRISDLEQDVQALKEQVGQMRIAMEELQRQNAALRSQLGQTGASAANAVSQAQLDGQIANLRAELIRTQNAQKNEIIDEVGRQMDRLASQTQRAAQTQAAAPEATFSDDFPKTGISYTVQKGDTLSSIARRLGSTMEDIRNANRISDPSKVMVGQTLFIPQRAK
jgi:LysM repeat protein